MDVPVWRGKSLRNSPRSGYQSRPSPELHSGGYRKDVREPRATQFRTTTALAAPCSSVCPSPYTNPKVKTFSGKDVFDFSSPCLNPAFRRRRKLRRPSASTGALERAAGGRLMSWVPPKLIQDAPPGVEATLDTGC